jgi:hypothetical protein
MPIPPPPKVPIDLNPADPSKLDAQALATQLENVGLNCAEITPDRLDQYITQVESEMPDGHIQSFAILAPAGTVTSETMPAHLAARRLQLAPAEVMAAAPVGSLAAAVPALEAVADGNWTENDSAQGYSANLEVIQYPDHFDWLMANQSSNGFPGIVDTPPAYTGYYDNATAIQKLFVNVAVTASSTVVKGVDTDTMTAVFSNAIQPLKDSNIANYDQPGSRAIMLVENYDSSTGFCDAVGVVSVDWRLQIHDYKRKSKDGGNTHYTVLNVSARSCLYSDVNLLCSHYNAVLKQFGIDPAQAPPCRTA